MFDSGGSVRVEEAHDGAVLAERRDARDAFFGLSGLSARPPMGRPGCASNFAGYALWNYLTIPFLL